MRINVTKTFLPPIEEYESYLKQIWDNDQLTNQGPLLNKLEKRIKEYLAVSNFQLVANGTMALQLALRALDITEGEVITTPFSYVATTSAILWERCDPVYVDIEPDNFCIDPDKIEAAITNKTKAIMPVHVFGHACDVEKINAIAKKYKIKVIYDAAHAFGVTYKNKSLLNYGDISACSFHATKPFHTIEGGALITDDPKLNAKIEIIKRFGHNYDDHIALGINGKASEFQAAMGLVNLRYIEQITRERKRLAELYDSIIADDYKCWTVPDSIEYNYAYYPVLFETEEELLKVMAKLADHEIYPRRYFYPSLNTLPYLKRKQNRPISESISNRILCLPLYAGLEDDNVIKICEVINNVKA